jgi:hypothetical protein
MKKAILLMTFSILTFFGANAQVNPGAIGARLGGGNFGSGAELSYQHGFGEANRVELDLGASFRNYGGYSSLALGISGIYHWVWNISDGFNWYVGPGAQVGYFSFSNNSFGTNAITLAVGGQGGLEYDFSTSFSVPMLLSLDLRPMWGFNGGSSGFGYGAALGIRYIL